MNVCVSCKPLLLSINKAGLRENRVERLSGAQDVVFIIVLFLPKH